MSDSRPMVIGSLLRGYIAVLDRRGYLAAVREVVSERALHAIDHPPFPLEYVETLVMEELMDALGRLHGRELVKDVGLEAARTKVGPIVFPFMRTMLTLWGTTPHSIFKQIQRLVGFQSRGIVATYEPETETSCVVEFRYPFHPGDFCYATWEGTFQLAFEACRLAGTVERSQLFDEGRRARIRLHW